MTAGPTATTRTAASRNGHHPRPTASLPLALRSTGGALTGPVTSSVTLPTDPHEVMNTVLHHALRRDLRRLAETLRQPVGDSRRALIREHLRFLLDQLHHHHTAEDELIWPAVLKRRPDLSDLFEQMESEHGRLGWVIQRLTVATEAWPSDEGRSAVRGAVVDLDQVLEPHLQHEEADAMPVICAVLTPKDWRPIDRKLRAVGPPAKMARVLFWMLDDLDDRRTAVVVALLPGPVWKALRLRYARRARRHAKLLWA